MTENNNKETWQQLEVVEIIDNPDGTADLIFEISDDFKEWFKKSFELKRWSKKRFQKVVMEAIEFSIEKEREKVQLETVP